MATLYRYDGNPTWYARFFDASGKRVSRSTGTAKKREARDIANDLEAKERAARRGNPTLARSLSVIVEAAAREAAAGELTLTRAEELIRKLHKIANPSFKEVTLAEHLASWVKAQSAHVGDSTLGIYADMQRRMLAALGPKIGGSPVGALTRDQVERALQKITAMKVKGTARTITAATANMDLRALRRALREAVEKGLSRSNPAEDVRPLPEDDSTERAPFTAEEVRQMLDAPTTSEEWRGAILIAAHTGLRLGDVLKLQKSHVSGTRLVIRPEKTKRGKKTLNIPLTPPCLAWIGGRGATFFPTLAKSKIGTLSTQFRRIMERAGVPREVEVVGEVHARRSFHSLRHSFASWLAEADIHADVRQKLTGHSDAGIHARYTHHDESLERAIEVLPSFSPKAVSQK